MIDSVLDVVRKEAETGIACMVPSFTNLWVEALDLVSVEPYNAVLSFHQLVEITMNAC